MLLFLFFVLCSLFFVLVHVLVLYLVRVVEQSGPGARDVLSIILPNYYDYDYDYDYDYKFK